MNKIALLAALAALLAGCAGSETLSTASVPEPIKAQAGESVSRVVPAKGVQVYECRVVKDRDGAFEWGFVAPDAELFDTNGRKIGTHYAGPKWEAADGSIVTGAVKGRADAPQAGNIPWLLLGTTASGPQGSFSTVSGIQRVNTVGGLAPASPCARTNLGAVARVPYTADYYFLSRM